MLRSTWGEMVVGGLGLAAIFLLLGVLGVIPIMLGAMIGGSGIFISLIIAIVY